MSETITKKTIDDFGEQWQVFRDNPGFYGDEHLLYDHTGPLLTKHDLQNTQVAEIGSGTGRIVSMLLDAGCAHVYALEPSDAMEVMQENLKSRASQITYLKMPGEELPKLNLDYIFSIGVIHHIPEPLPVLRRAHDALKDGGRLFVWLYGREGNETYLALAEPLRKITKRLPHFLLMTLALILDVFLEIYIALCRILPLPMHVYMQQVLGRFPHKTRLMTIYDQLNPAYAKYYYEDEARALLKEAGFSDVQMFHRHGYSWSVIGTKRSSS